VSAGADPKAGDRPARSLVPSDLALAVALCAGALLLETIAFLGSDPWIGADLVGAGFLLVFVSDVIVEPGRIAGRPTGAGWGRAIVALLVGMALLVVRPSPMPHAVVQGLAVAGAAFSVFEGLLKAGSHRP
jgi:FtsH-binding integral membrane protein